MYSSSALLRRFCFGGHRSVVLSVLSNANELHMQTPPLSSSQLRSSRFFRSPGWGGFSGAGRLSDLTLRSPVGIQLFSLCTTTSIFFFFFSCFALASDGFQKEVRAGSSLEGETTCQTTAGHEFTGEGRRNGIGIRASLLQTLPRML